MYKILARGMGPCSGLALLYANEAYAAEIEKTNTII
jgi:hypothetical protein